MSFKIEHGDLFEHSAEALGHGVNCHGIAGGGVAKIMSEKYPKSIQVYQLWCKGEDPFSQSWTAHPGSALLVQDKGKWILHCASQYHPGPDAREGWLHASLTRGLRLLDDKDIKTVAVPLIGGGIGGIDPARAVEIIQEVAELSPLDVTLVLPE